MNLRARKVLLAIYATYATYAIVADHFDGRDLLLLALLPFAVALISPTPTKEGNERRLRAWL